MRFSEYFQLKKRQNELDFVDIPIDGDIQLFIDPFALSKRDDELSIEASQTVASFFQEVIDSIRSGSDDLAKRMLSKLNESNDIHFGLSRDNPRGRGVGDEQSLDLFDSLKSSRAVQTGFIHDLQDCELVIPGIGYDKISDVVARLIKLLLIGYTYRQCQLHGIETEEISSGAFWNAIERNWDEQYVNLPVVEVSGKKERVVLVPKAFARYTMAFNHAKYYNGFVLEYLQRQHIRENSSLVYLLKDGSPKVDKKDLKEKPEYKLTKQFLYEFSNEHPEILDSYRQVLSTLAIRPIKDQKIEEKQKRQKSINIEPLIKELQEIPAGMDTASKYHNHMIGVLTALFYPNLINPVKELEVHEGRKRIDISFSNAAKNGFFLNLTNQGLFSPLIFFECKNYSKDMGNPEIDQMAGRFAPTRGRFGIILCRTITDKSLIIKRCKDTASDARGFIVVLEDNDVIQLLRYKIEENEEEINNFLRTKLEEIIV